MAKKKGKSPAVVVFSILIPLAMLNVALMAFSPATTFWIGLLLLTSVAMILLSLFPFFAGNRWAILSVSYFLKGSIPVELIDFQGDRHNSIARIDRRNRLCASVYWFNDVGKCILNTDGKVDANSDACYVYFWIPLRKIERAEHVLKHNIPDLDQLYDLDEIECRAIMSAAYKGSQ